MTCTQHVARAAAQLHEAAQEVARVAARRSAQAEGQIAEAPEVQPPELTDDPADENENHQADDTTAPKGGKSG